MPLRLLSRLLLVLLLGASGAGVPGPARSATLTIDLFGTDLVTDTDFDLPTLEQSGGSARLARLLDSPPLPASDAFGGPAVAEGYADDSGTFWALGRTGLAAHSANVIVHWGMEFVKQSASAELTADITGGVIELQDFGGGPEIDLFGKLIFAAAIDGEDVLVHSASVQGRADDFILEQSGDLSASTSYQTFSSVGGATDDTALWTLAPQEIPLDLSQVAVGERFHVRYDLVATVVGAGGETIAEAWFRDPVSGSGGVALTTSGLVPVPEPGTAGLVGVAAIALAAARRRRASRP